MQNYIGQQIDRYRITERLGMGGICKLFNSIEIHQYMELYYDKNHQ
jgi:hypothetical protein